MLTIAGCLKDSNSLLSRGCYSGRARHHSGLLCTVWWVFKVNPRQWIPLLSFDPGPEHPLSFSAGVLGGIVLDSFGLVGESCSSLWGFHYCWVLCFGFFLNHRTSDLTSNAVWKTLVSFRWILLSFLFMGTLDILWNYIYGSYCHNMIFPKWVSLFFQTLEACSSLNIKGNVSKFFVLNYDTMATL